MNNARGMNSAYNMNSDQIAQYFIMHNICLLDLKQENAIAAV
jgi:hypothetical protein